MLSRSHHFSWANIPQNPVLTELGDLEIRDLTVHFRYHTYHCCSTVSRPF